MSETTTLKTTLTDEPAIWEVANELNRLGISCRLERNKIPRMYSNSRGVQQNSAHRNQLAEHGIKGFKYTRQEADLCLVLDNASYDLAFLKKPDGTFAVVFDSWNGTLGKQIGANNKKFPQGAMKGQDGDVGLFMALYGKQVIMSQAEEEGLYVESCEYDKEGNLELVTVGYD